MEEDNDIYNDIYNNTYDNNIDSATNKSEFVETKINDSPQPIIETKINDSPQPIIETKLNVSSSKMRTFAGYYIDNTLSLLNDEFKLLQEKQFGTFYGAKPKQAAAKACASLSKITKPDGYKFIKIIETTKGSRNKSFYFKCKRLQLECPVTVKLSDGREITYNYNINVQKSSEDEYKNNLLLIM
jgi:hypothetical protein